MESLCLKPLSNRAPLSCHLGVVDTSSKHNIVSLHEVDEVVTKHLLIYIFSAKGATYFYLSLEFESKIHSHFSSVFGLHQLLNVITLSWVHKVHQLVTVVVCCLVLSR